MRLEKRIAALLDILTAPHSTDPDTALMEYMTKMILIVLSLVTIPFSLISTIGWFTGIIPPDTLIILYLMSFLFVAGWLIAHCWNWHIGSLIPPVILLITAVYGNIIGGIDAPAILIYVLAILLLAVLRGIGYMYLGLFFSLAAYILTGLAHRSGLITQIRSAETAFMNRVIIAVASIISISFLIRFLIIQYRKALAQERMEVAERSAVESALRKSERKYRELVQNANSIILRMNMNGEIVFCNEFGEKFFGYAGGEMIGKKIVDLIVPERDTEGRNLHEMIECILRAPEDFRSNENENITRDGERVWINWANKSVTDESGRVIEVLCIGNDITERKRALEERERMEAQLIQSQKMEAVGTLTSGLAHDFNNMLAGIMGSLSLLDMLLKQENITERGEAEKYMEMALESSKRASDMIKKLLMLSRRQKIQLMPVDINKSVEHVMEICGNSFPKSVSLNVQYGDRAMNVMADPILIEQILLNFCVNASHAMTIMREPGEKEGGELSIRVSSSILDGPELLRRGKEGSPASFIVTEITDTGIGMDHDIQKRIFEPFFTMKKREAGTGLGLSMAYGLISQLNGFIELESEINKGSTFSIFIPELSEELAVNGTGTKRMDIVRGTGTILVVDDELSVLSVAEDILRLCGYAVLKATDGIEGISLYEKNIDRIDAVLLDISMPFMSGFEVFERLRMINDSVVVLLSSGYPDDERIATAISKGGVRFIQKPYTAEELSCSISEALQMKG